MSPTTSTASTERVFFLHFRDTSSRFDPSGFTYLSANGASQAKAKGGATVAYTFDDKGVKFAIAKVSPKDRYEKAIGRKVSTERLSTDRAGYWPGSVHAFRAAIGTALNG